METKTHYIKPSKEFVVEALAIKEAGDDGYHLKSIGIKPYMQGYRKGYALCEQHNKNKIDNHEALLSALKDITKTFENICTLYAEQPVNWEHYRTAKEVTKKAEEII